jgi:hypothetical protein
MSDNDTNTINIRPATSVYATYQRLSYKPWYAIAEFVDNSTQNYYDHKEELQAAYRREHPNNYLKIEIDYDDENRALLISDNAHGMEIEELQRAIVLDKPPINRSGRCEFGMGLKTAACWFGATWTITTKKLGSTRELTARVHVPDLVKHHSETIRVIETPADKDRHYTHIKIEGLYKPIKGRTFERIYDQLGSMYRVDLRSGDIEIYWDGKPIVFVEPPIHTENFGNNVVNTWKKEIEGEVLWEAAGTQLKFKGWVGIRLPANQRDAGFVLIRRGRVIVGGPGEGYKPVEVFGQPNSFRSQRLIGEFQMDDWPVTQAKDAFDWSGGLEDEFIDFLKVACKDYMDKCEDIRDPLKKITTSDMLLVSEDTQQVFSDTRFAKAIEEEITIPEPLKTEAETKKDTEKLTAVSEGPISYHLNLTGEKWEFRLHWQDQLSDAHWMSVSYPQDNITDIFLNIAHPFFAKYVNMRGFLGLIQKFVVALALAERMARKLNGNGLVAPDDFRNFMNKVLRRVSELEEKNGS